MSPAVASSPAPVKTDVPEQQTLYLLAVKPHVFLDAEGRVVEHEKDGTKFVTPFEYATVGGQCFHKKTERLVWEGGRMIQREVVPGGQVRLWPEQVEAVRAAIPRYCLRIVARRRNEDGTQGLPIRYSAQLYPTGPDGKPRLTRDVQPLAPYLEFRPIAD
jgi:hypothetical protein